MSDEQAEPEVGWNVPGWDWDPSDNAWLASQSGLHVGGTSIFFIHGGRIRHQAHIPEGHYAIDEFCELLRVRAEGLDAPYVVWTEDSGGGSAGLWVEGTRPPNEDDLARLQAARERQRFEDALALKFINERRAADERRRTEGPPSSGADDHE